MKVIIAGSRTWEINPKNLNFLEQEIKKSEFEITEVVSGGAAGMDLLGEVWAETNKIPCKLFDANWNKHGKAAGPIRNEEMAKYAEAAIVLIDPNAKESKGSLNMIETAKKYNLKVYTNI